MSNVLTTAENKRVLCELTLRPEYRSDGDDLVRDFYIPCLQRSILYRRAVGYFTSRGLAVAAQGITALIRGGGRMLLVASPLFDSDDMEAIATGYSTREDLIANSLLRQIETTPTAVVHDRLGYLAWLIAEGRLDIRIAVPIDGHARVRAGIYHEKMGIFSDDAGNAIAFTGSPNETQGGLIENFEATDVFWSWEDSHGRVERKIENFCRLWENQTSGLDVIAFPEAARKQLLAYRPSSPPVREFHTIPTTVARIPTHGIELWEHQTEAIEAWEANGRRGIVSMATASGKTLVALVAAERCPELELLVIVVPRGALVEQWRDELKVHTRLPAPVLAHQSSAQWQASLFNRLRAARKRPHRQPVVVVGTLASIAGDRFEGVLADAGLPQRCLLIVDEVHNSGAPTYSRTLRDGFGWRLGLSATPTRHFDEEGTATIRSYFGPTVYSYDMRRALADGRLCPYHYYVYPAHLSEYEYEEYTQLTRRIMQLRGAGTEAVSTRTDNRLDGDSAAVDQLLFRRARVLKRCQAKIAALHKALDEHPMRRGLVYCADTEQLTDVCAVLDRRQEVFLTYTAATPSDSRQAALDALSSGHVPVLVAIDCLDEGVDVPSVDAAVILASSGNKRQFIQRRGRILRRAPGKPVATLVDVIALPPVTAGSESRRMLNGELARAKEMAELAANKYGVLRRLKACTGQFGVYLTELLSGEGDG